MDLIKLDLTENNLIEKDLTEKESMNMDIIELKDWLVKKNLNKHSEKILTLINMPLYV